MDVNMSFEERKEELLGFVHELARRKTELRLKGVSKHDADTLMQLSKACFQALPKRPRELVLLSNGEEKKNSKKKKKLVWKCWCHVCNRASIARARRWKVSRTASSSSRT
jgi:hypothetical protein